MSRLNYGVRARRVSRSGLQVMIQPVLLIFDGREGKKHHRRGFGIDSPLRRSGAELRGSEQVVAGKAAVGCIDGEEGERPREESYRVRVLRIHGFQTEGPIDGVLDAVAVFP